jgi:hypothetical protein
VRRFAECYDKRTDAGIIAAPKCQLALKSQQNKATALVKIAGQLENRMNY